MILQENRVEGEEEGFKRIVILGGTFDKLHKGHLKILKLASKISNEIKIGLVKNKMINNKFLSKDIENFYSREKNIKNFFKRIKNKELKIEIIPLSDPYGPSLNLKEITDIIVTEETLPRAIFINKVRKSKGLNKLRIHKIKLVLSEDLRIIRSSRIRAKEINKNGELLVKEIKINY